VQITLILNSISQNLFEKRGVNKRNSFWFLLKVVGANRENKANFGFHKRVGICDAGKSVLTLTLLTDWYWWSPSFISLALGCAMASQGEAFAALKADSISVCVVMFKSRYSPIPDLWDWTYHL